jgi:hypothetical protein
METLSHFDDSRRFSESKGLACWTEEAEKSNQLIINAIELGS